VANRRLSLSLIAAGIASALRADSPPPHLQTRGAAGQLIVDGEPFLIRGGELNNSSATNPEYLRPYWAQFQALHLNTLLAPVYWDLIEPEAGRFDFGTVDGLLRQARENHCRLVLLWFGSWKNSMSCYAPAWIKGDPNGFPRARDARGDRQEILSPFSPVNRDTDARAFATLLRHLRETDGADHTVIMVQVENEIGMIPVARDHSPEADRAFLGPVPPELMDYLARHAEELAPELRSLWAAAGRKPAGTWTEVFGDGPAAEEIFMAWHFARYTDSVAAAGRREYPIPLYLNAALIRPGHAPGQYPSGGPLPHLFDIWRAGAPSIDLLSPDIYFKDFLGWARRYRQPGNPLFIPESQPVPESGVRALYSFGALDAVGFCTFAIDGTPDPVARNLAAGFDLVEQLQPLIVFHQQRGTIAGFLPEGPEQRQPARVRLGGYILSVTFDRGAPGGSAGEPAAPPSGGLAIAAGPDEFVVAGTGVTITFEPASPGPAVGILSDEEGRFTGGQWRNILWLGGDQTNQGRQIRLEPGRYSIQRVRLYRY
jgi:hypothetical protein